MLDEDQTSGVDETTETATAETVEEPTGVAEEQAETPAPAVVTTVTTTRRKAVGRPAGPPTTGLFSAPLADPLADEETVATLPAAPQATTPAAPAASSAQAKAAPAAKHHKKHHRKHHKAGASKAAAPAEPAKS